MNNKYRSYIVNFIAYISIFLGLLISFNIFIDPLWMFTHKNFLNSKQIDFDEREQKTNYINSNSIKDFDSILLGSSRSTFINQNSFAGMKVYNYAVNSMYPTEYREYINFFKDKVNNELKYIILGIDFFGTNKKFPINFNKPSFYLDRSKSIFYKFKNLLSYDMFEFSKKNIKNYFYNKELIYYDRNNIKYHDIVDEATRKTRFKMTLLKHINDFKDKNYEYNENYIQIFEKIKQENKNSKFVVFTPPVTADLLVALIRDTKRYDEYKRWLYDLIYTFDKVYHFMDINNMTTNLLNYPDDDHMYPKHINTVAKIISSETNKKDNFGVLLDKNNVKEYLDELQKKLKYYEVRYE
ncbi:hypothetical protein FJR48_02525 [Sulfurimonas lithotrophica]|uniref:DUF1574 domain-containing protein n=1 Tax=Sulfurimonas lithotrophica TaxID=2590022 RepID=A0A5P8NZ92_9BACT|nr:hypothetical protein [Sulfurimonas lithotrophica]QFR48657.1 hypothetical protein FJR48_02525 [Sulfurimonas lithotrophica]